MMALLSGAARAEVEQVATEIEKIETATASRFQEFFVEAMGIPNSKDHFPKLASAVDLPALQPAAPRPARRRRRAATEGGQE